MDKNLLIVAFLILFLTIIAVLFLGPKIYKDLLNDDPVNKIILAFILYVIFCIFYFITQLKSEGFYFELTPEKKCDGGPYMYSSDPQRQALCSKFSKADLARYQCSYGNPELTGRMLYHGRPVWWGGAGNGTLSNANWQNPSCSSIDPKYNDPQVL